MNNYELVVGLEIHVELATQSKMFCGCPADWFGKEPNTQTCPVCLGLPGALPVPNKTAIEWCILIGKALNCKTTTVSKFDRKHYFYPDLPKGYQISQYDQPFSYEGTYEMLSRRTGEIKKIGITRVHMEEDTGKLNHEGTDTLIDFNRSGVPLVEIVTEPDFDNSEDVRLFLEELQVIIRYLHVSDADMEKGSMRLEPNISVRLESAKSLPNYKVEVKNINSFKFAKAAIDFEMKRHIELLEKGDTPVQETRGYNENMGITVSQRVKEEAQDYRYFPEPDIPPFVFDKKFIDDIEKQLPELPDARVNRYISDLKLKASDAYRITRSNGASIAFEKILEAVQISLQDNVAISSEAIIQGTANVFINKLGMPDDLSRIEEYKNATIGFLTPKQTDVSALSGSVDSVLARHAREVEEYRSGKVNIIMFLVGQVMKEMKGQADAQAVRKALEEKLMK